MVVMAKAKKVNRPRNPIIQELLGMFQPYAQAENTHSPALRLHQKPEWPKPLDEAAYHGLAGEFIKLVAPNTEADPVALLIQFLVAFGNVIGRTAHFKVNQDIHYLNLFACLVGQSAHGRKGLSWNQVKDTVGNLDQEWAKHRIVGGLASGEGLINALRDPQAVKSPKGLKRQAAPVQKVMDKRLMLVEPEFARVLKVMEREGNTLSAIMRQAWDGHDLNVLTRNDPLRATEPHVSTITHITEQDLKRYLSDTDMANGFGNRFMWFGVKRSRLLPHGGQVDQKKLTKIFLDLMRKRDFSTRIGELKRDPEASLFWEKLYAELEEDKDGMHGALTLRASAQVMRLACLYALLGESKFVKICHLQAAKAIWDYADATVAYLYGNSLGDPDADRILAHLDENQEGLTRSEIHGLFSRQRSAERISDSLERLEKRGLAYRESESTGGRPIERWFAK